MAPKLQLALALTIVQDVLAGGGIEPPNGNYSACGVHLVMPHVGRFNVSVYSLSNVSRVNSSYSISIYTPETTNTAGLVLESSVGSNSKGEFLLDLPSGDYGFMLTYRRLEPPGSTTSASERFTIVSGATTRVGFNVSIIVP